jgi:hypothetical protein
LNHITSIDTCKGLWRALSFRLLERFVLVMVVVVCFLSVLFVWVQDLLLFSR